MAERFFRRLLGQATMGFVLLVPPCIAFSPSTVLADGRHLALNYDIYVGGLRTLNISYDALLKQDEYDMKMALKGRGVLDWWFSWTMKAFSEGKVAEGAIVPVRAGADSSWSGKRRQTRITYVSNGLPKVEITPTPEDAEKRPKVPAELRREARDLAGAVLAALTRVGRTGRCDVREPVFDGRRRYDLLLEHLGEDRLEASRYSPFAGPALRCRVSVDRIAGYREGEGQSRWRSKDEATIWLGRPFEGSLPVPVQLEMDTVAGAMRAYLTDGTASADGRHLRLTAAQ